MSWFRKGGGAARSESERTRVFFATDIHGSEACWRKFLRAADFYDADALILGGDMTGKGLAPIMSLPNERYRGDFLGETRILDGADELAAYMGHIRERGFYPLVVSEDELRSLSEDESALEAAFEREIRGTVERWVELAEDMPDSDVRVYVCPGNDDDSSIDDILAASDRIELGEGRLVGLGKGGFVLASTGWTNPTPWETHREEEEQQLEKRIESMLSLEGYTPERLILNFHCPPYGTSLDEAPALDDELRVVAGGRSTMHVGSTAVREAIDRVQPLVSLHGHVHEARAATHLGRTLVVNPGSAYEIGVLQGVVVTADGPDRVRYQLTSG